MRSSSFQANNPEIFSNPVLIPNKSFSAGQISKISFSKQKNKLEMPKHRTESLDENLIKLGFSGIFPMPSDFLIKYCILEEIGQGKQGKVYSIKDIDSQAIFTAKIYQTFEEEIVQNIENERNIFSSLSHQNIIKYKEFYKNEQNSCFVLVMEYFESITLKEFIEDHPITPDVHRIIMDQLYESLTFLHQKSIVHRDFNAENILINIKSFEIKVIDFGVSLKCSNFAEIDSEIGNFQYRMPKSLQTLKNPFLPDVWSFGLIVMSLAFKKNITTRKMKKIMKSEDVLPIGKINGRELVENFRAFLRKDSDDFTTKMLYTTAFM